MSKLLYINKSLADSKTWLGNDWNAATNAYYRSIVFTSDGYIITHGKSFNGNNSTYQLTLNGTTNGSGTSLGTLYAPTTAGSNHQIIQSSGSGAPSWVSLVTSLAASEDYTVPTSYAVAQAIANATAGLTGAMHFKGVATVQVTDGGTQNPTITGYDWSKKQAGDVVLYGAKEFVWTGSAWEELGDEGSFLLNSAKPLSSTTLSISDTTIGAGITINLATITVTNSPATGNNIVNGLTVDSYGRVTAVSYATAALTDTTHNFYVGATTAKADAAVTSGTDVYLTTKLTSAASSAAGTNILGFHEGTGISISASNAKLITVGLKKATTSAIGGIVISNALTSAVTLTSANGSTANRYYGVQVDKDGKAFVNIPWVNTWRNVTAYLKSNNTSTEILSTTVGTADLDFGSEFLWDGDTTNGTLHIGWAEVAADGTVTYAV